MIKSLLLLIGFSLLTTVNTFSQESYLGIKGGYNLSKLKSEGVSRIGLDDKHAYNFALVFGYKARNAPIGMSLEPGYTLKGTRVNQDTLSYKFHYLSLPFLIDYYPIERLKISVGPEISFLTGARNKGDTTVSIANMYNNKWELSGTVGVSYSLGYFADFGVRYNSAFTKISDMDALIDRRKLFNQYFQAYLLFKIAN